MRLHDSDADTLNRTRLAVIDQVRRHTGTEGVWVFDRGNDDGQFFTELEQRQLRFVVRLRSNQHLTVRETGEVMAVEVVMPKSGEEYLTG